MRVECAWCGAVMSGLNDPPPVSHGICSPCKLAVLEENGHVPVEGLAIVSESESVETIWGPMPVGGED